jgi:hypothetical protein
MVAADDAAHRIAKAAHRQSARASYGGMLNSCDSGSPESRRVRSRGAPRHSGVVHCGSPELLCREPWTPAMGITNRQWVSRLSPGLL